MTCIAKYVTRISRIDTTETNAEPVMERDMRLTGSLRGQTDRPEAPAGFELNNPWKVRNSKYTLKRGCGSGANKAALQMEKRQY